MNWIFKSIHKDALYLLGPILLGTIYCLLVGKYHFAWFALVVHGIDQTHVASTSWRTIFNKKQSKLFTLGIPLAVLLVISILTYINFSYFWTTLTYIGIIHLVRQNYGVIRWYHKANGYFDKFEEYIFYFFSFLPFALVHFKEGLVLTLFEDGKFLHYPAQTIFKQGMYAYLALVFLWLFYEIFVRKHFTKCVGSKVFIFFNSLFSYFVLTRLTTSAQITDTFLFAHGLHYLALNLLSIKKVSRPKFWVYGTIGLAGLALFFVYLKFPSPFKGFDLSLNAPTLALAILGAIYYLPVLSHYTYDAFIWRSTDVDAQKIYS